MKNLNPEFWILRMDIEDWENRTKLTEIFAQLMVEFPGWTLGDLKDVSFSVAPRMSPEAAKVQNRFNELDRTIVVPRTPNEASGWSFPLGCGLPNVVSKFFS